MNEMNISSTPLDEKWLDLFYARVTAQYNLSRQSLHNTHQWVISLTLALITAILTLGGDNNPYPNEYGFIALVVSLPILFRFFVRSCLESSIQYKWQEIRDALDQYFYCRNESLLLRENALKYLKETIELYYFKWKSPRSLKKLVLENLRLAYLWSFLLWSMMIVWGAVNIHESALIWTVIVFVGLFLFYELISFVLYNGFKHEETKTIKPINRDLPNKVINN